MSLRQAPAYEPMTTLRAVCGLIDRSGVSLSLSLSRYLSLSLSLSLSISPSASLVRILVKKRPVILPNSAFRGFFSPGHMGAGQAGEPRAKIVRW